MNSSGKYLIIAATLLTLSGCQSWWPQQAVMVQTPSEDNPVSVQANPQQANEFNRMGMLARQRGQFEQARDYYKKSLEAMPGYPLAHRNLGILYDLYLGQKTLAERHYQDYLQALEALPEGHQAQSEIKTVKRWLGDLRRQISAQQQEAL